MKKLEPYKRRTIKPGEDVWVYRNLMRTDGVWYSLVQRSLVVAHAQEVALVDVRFIVREGGRQRVLSSGVKNVHAFVVGRLLGREPTWEEHGGEPRKARYNPRREAHFEVVDPDYGTWFPLHWAKAAHLTDNGLIVRGVYCSKPDTADCERAVTYRKT